MRCVNCGGPIGECLAALGSLRCHDCREAAPLGIDASRAEAFAGRGARRAVSIGARALAALGAAAALATGAR